MQTLTCQYCNNTFTPSRTNYKNPKQFCGLSCSNEARRVHLPKACVQCGVTTTNPKFCSSSCAATCNNTLQPKRKAKPKPIRKKPILTEEEKYKKHRAISNEANARYRSRCKYQTPADENIKALREFYINCPVGHEVDHIIPISKGGAHSLSNLQYLTKEANRRKSNKLDWVQ
jgi:5-methylcytosine-specific restriction endonuclease McrA